MKFQEKRQQKNKNLILKQCEEGSTTMTVKLYQNECNGCLKTFYTIKKENFCENCTIF